MQWCVKKRKKKELEETNDYPLMQLKDQFWKAVEE